MRPVTLNLNRVLLEFETLMRHAAGPQIELRMKLDPGLDPSNVDRAQFEAAILNLVVNARDALPKGGRIIIETTNVVIDEADPERASEIAPGAYALVGVSDNGVGIEPSVLSHVFEPFFTTKEIGKGSGLGLSQVFGFATESKGQVSISSQRGRGTTVKLYLPRSVEAYWEIQKRSLIATETANGEETVLVVDDDEGVLTTATEIVADLGYHVLSAQNGQQALQILKEAARVDLLFSDIVMPGGINGVQLAREARRLKPKLKVLLTSGYSAAVLIDKHSLPKEFPVLGKPYRREQLASNLRDIIKSPAHQTIPHL
jgi:CheY-like chemotaxis protein